MTLPQTVCSNLIGTTAPSESHSDGIAASQQAGVDFAAHSS